MDAGSGMNSQKSQGVQKVVKFLRRILPYVLCYLLWGITIALAFLNLITARSLYLTIMGVLSVQPWSASAIDKITFLFLAIVWLVLAIFSEYYYRTSISKNRLWKSFSLMTGIQLLFLFAAHLLPSLLVGVRSFTWIDYILFAGELGAGLVLLLIALHSSSRNIAVGTFKEKNKLT
jgi:hypothetical protein